MSLPAGMMTVLGAALFAAVTPHYSWYYPWLALPACIAPSWSVIYLASAAFVLMLDPIHDQVLWPSLLFIPFVILAAFDLRRASGGERQAGRLALTEVAFAVVPKKDVAGRVRALHAD